jgi:hypothetical protein
VGAQALDAGPRSGATRAPRGLLEFFLKVAPGLVSRAASFCKIKA